ncbi:MAG: dipeptide epimerase [Pseudomonadales bacterium]|jgi:L-alanine-DL-glutamate epimerase-like enolase superfamily enzyme|nr:dipeptide epimerase [Pseudomonadales bacterium]
MASEPRLAVASVDWPLREPFVIAGWRYESMPVIVVELSDGQGRTGRGEAVGVDYLGETVASMQAQLRALDLARLGPMDPLPLQGLLPPGGARNALDCALWDLHAQREGASVFDLLGIDLPGPFPLLGTLSLGAPEAMAEAARRHADWPRLKLKLGGGDGRDVERVRAVRTARPDAELLVDVNGAWDCAALEAAAEPLAEAGVRLVEQPLPPGADDGLRRGGLPVPLCADESCQHAGDLERCATRYEYVNVKLDKCGGLTEALRMVARARELGVGLMVGNMCGSSLAMAPALIVASHCGFVDLDGPLLQTDDVADPLVYADGQVAFGPTLPWGTART